MAGALQQPRPNLDRTAQMVSQVAPLQQQSDVLQPEGAPVSSGVAEDLGTIGGEMPGSEAATPQEQEAKDQIVTAGQTVLFQDGEAKDGVIRQLKAGADNPPQAIADVVRNIIGALDAQSGNTIPQVVVLPAAAELVGEVAEVAKAHGELFDVDQRILGQATQLTVAGLAEDYGVDPNEIKEMLDSIPQEQMQAIAQEQSQYG